MQTLITNIQGYSIHDGPGIRTVVFIKGCGLSCRWCANPETISPRAQTGFIENLCAHCGKCLATCPEGAINADEAGGRINQSRCTGCGKCVDACYYGALVRYGKLMGVQEVFEAVSRDKMFYEDGGGVTVSGGEPLLQYKFVKALFELCKDDGISTCIETSGFAPAGNLRELLPVTDYLLFDLKHLNSETHSEYTGQPNSLILENARLAAQSGADILFRMPLIPTVNDSAENIKETAEFLKDIQLRTDLPAERLCKDIQLRTDLPSERLYKDIELQEDLPAEWLYKDIELQEDLPAEWLYKGMQQSPKLQLMPYHRLGGSKYKALGLPEAMPGLEIMKPERLEEVKNAFESYGVECSISK